MMKKYVATGRFAGFMVTAALVIGVLTACGTKVEAETSGTDGVTVVKVGTGNNTAPFCYLDEDENPIGYDLDVLRELDKRLENYEFDIQTMDFSTLVVSIDSGAIDMISHQLVKSEARKEKYLFPDEYYCLSPMSLCVRSDSGIANMEDMAEKTMELNPSSYEYLMMMAYNENNPGKEVKIIGRDTLFQYFTGTYVYHLTINSSKNCLDKLGHYKAYIEFAMAPDCESMIGMVKRGIEKPVIVLRTFSKYYAMAGVRVGYAVAAPELIEAIKKCPCSCNINNMGQAAAVAAMNDQEYYKTVKRKVVEGRDYLEQEMETLGCKVYPSQTNFIYFDTQVSPEWLRDEFLARGIMISANQISRVSVGTMAENRIFIDVMKEILGKVKAAS